MSSTRVSLTWERMLVSQDEYEMVHIVDVCIDSQMTRDAAQALANQMCGYDGITCVRTDLGARHTLLRCFVARSVAMSIACLAGIRRHFGLRAP